LGNLRIEEHEKDDLNAAKTHQAFGNWLEPGETLKIQAKSTELWFRISCFYPMVGRVGLEPTTR
jgi:hypothetical protein